MQACKDKFNFTILQLLEQKRSASYFDLGSSKNLFKQCYNIKLSRGEICVANFIPPANGVRQGNYLLAKM